MRPRILVSAAAALSAALTAAVTAAADPQPLPPVRVPASATVTAPALPPVPNAKPIAPAQLPTTKPIEKSDTPTQLPEIAKPRTPGEPAPKVADAPIPTAEPHSAAPADLMMPVGRMPIDTSIHDDHLGPWNAVWARGGYNYLWIKNAPASPVLLSSSGTPLVGNTTTDYGGFSAISFDAGAWLNERHTLGVGVSGFLSEKRSVGSAFTSDGTGSPGFTRPFYNAQIGGTNGLDGFIVSAPGLYSGSFAVEQGARVDGFEVYGIMNVANSEKWTVNFNVGFRYFDLDEYITTYQVTQGLNGNTIPFFGQGSVDSVAITDRFRTRNQMYAPQLGGDLEYRKGIFFFDLGAKAALGPVHQVTQVSGTTQAMTGSGPGGFLAVSAVPNGSIPNGNVGNTSTTNFAVLADVSALIGVQVSSHIRLGVGYQFLYLNNVARPSNQVVTSIDPRIVPTSTSWGAITPSNTALGGSGTPPNTPYNRDDFFLSGLRFQLELQY